MNKFRYYYNTETCQYERVTIKIRDIILYSFGMLVMSSVFLTIILFAHNHLVDTDRELSLRGENKTLKKHKPVLEAELARIEETLAELQHEDEILYRKLFNTEQETSPRRKSTISKEQVLLADAAGFRSLLQMLKEKSSLLVNRSIEHNREFGNDIHISKDDVTFIASIPSIQPILNPELNKLVSGFGTRVNPFHKGMYTHPGVDLAAQRNTEIYATAGGTVVNIKRSKLEAGYGNYIEINHGHGFITRYAHLEEILVKPHEKVKKGSVIGTVGSSGGSSAPHLHYEVIRDGEQVDPVQFMLEGLTSKEHNTLLQLSRKQNQALD